MPFPALCFPLILAFLSVRNDFGCKWSAQKMLRFVLVVRQPDPMPQCGEVEQGYLAVAGLIDPRRRGSAMAG